MRDQKLTFRTTWQLTGALEDAEFSFFLETVVPLKLGFLKYPVCIYLIFCGLNVKQELSIFVECLHLLNIS
jgi:hypothetical protein